jgi:hypothetical protein
VSAHAATLRDEVREEVAAWRRDPALFVRSVLGVRTLWEKQVEILEALRDHPRVAVAACHDSGKTYLAACAAWWFSLAYQPAKVITTAPTDRQVRQLLWAEIRALHGNARVPLPGNVLTTHWQMPGHPDWFMTGFATTQDSAQEHATRFQGYHSPNLLLIFDEASGIERPIWDAADGLMTSGHCRHLAIGNPTDPTGEFARAYRSTDWHSIQIDALQTPNLVSGEDTVPFLVSNGWVADMRRKYGEGAPAYLSKVRGLFPGAADDTLIALGWVQEALTRTAEPQPDAVRSMGVDVARFGSDLTCIYVVEGGTILHAEVKAGQDLMRTSGRVIRVAH